jgi:hypothetical protein
VVVRIVKASVTINTRCITDDMAQAGKRRDRTISISGAWSNGEVSWEKGPRMLTGPPQCVSE